MLSYLTPQKFCKKHLKGIKVLKRTAGNQGSKSKGKKYMNVICAFDIETTRFTSEELGGTVDKDQAIMYSWALHIHHYCTIHGRTWKEFEHVLDVLRTVCKPGASFVIFVHNLSYEFQFLRNIHKFAQDEVFAVKSRRVLKCNIGQEFEFRCSYLHSNMSLEEYTRTYKAEHQKLSGEEFDYSKKRFPWTPLTGKEIAYQLHDVIGLCEALENEMLLDGDNLYSIPLTSTGYVRRKARQAMWKASHIWLKSILPTGKVFDLLRGAFRGGDTHANRYISGQIMRDVKSADRSSSYPDVQCNRPFPLGKFQFVEDPTLPHLQHLLERERAIVARIRFRGIELKDRYYPAPYISKDKCNGISKGVYDNGRVLSAEWLEICLTDIDMRIIFDTYKFDSAKIVELAYTRYAALPEELTAVAKHYYQQKTILKGAKTDDAEMLYAKSKAILNAIYGMTAQNPGKEEYIFDGEDFVIDEKSTDELLLQHYRTAFLTYAWGVWTTAWARYELYLGQKLVLDSGGILCYWDTDSVKYVGEVDWSDYNTRCIKASTASGACAADAKGEYHYMGVFEQEKSYAEFATLGAKKYAFRYYDEEIPRVTIAGVTKSKGGTELVKGDSFGSGLERFCMAVDVPFTFVDAGGTESVYNDTPAGYQWYKGVGIDCGYSVVIKDSTYTLGVTAEYNNLLKHGDLGLDTWALTM